VVLKTGNNALPTTAWQSDVTLQADTTYYWKVRAVSSQTFSAWSRVNVFITESAPVTTTSAEVPTVTKTLTETETETLTVTSTTVSTQPVIQLTTTVQPAVTTSNQLTDYSATQSQTTVTVTPTTTSQIIQIEQKTPDWLPGLFWIGGGLLLVMVCLVVLTLVIAVRLKR